MEAYANRSGDSSVDGFECGPDWIRVRFTDGAVYMYDAAKPGAGAVQRMQAYARAGTGLSSYINRSVGKNYARREG